MTVPPTARFGRRRKSLILASIPCIVAVGWGFLQFDAVYNVTLHGHGSSLAIVFAFSFLLLWWIPFSWSERPFTVSDEGPLDDLVLTVHVPVYNEDPVILRSALASLLAQTRLPNRIHVVDDGSLADYTEVRDEFVATAGQLGIATVWRRTENRGKRYAQMETLATDDADIFCTLDSDSTLDRAALREGLKPFADARVKSVAGMVVVWNSRKNWLTRLTCMLYTPFTRGFRPAQSNLGRVMVNSGTLAFYRAEVVRRHSHSYPRETFRGRPMQMNDDSMLTFYSLLEGRTVHQPTAVAFTLVPERFPHYIKQQLRWMRGTFVRQAWWFRYLSMKDVAWWMPLFELIQLALALIVVPVLYITLPRGESIRHFLLAALFVGIGLNYLVSLRYFIIERSDEGRGMQIATFAIAPIAGIWRIFLLRPLIVYAMITCWKVSNWGTRGTVEIHSVD